MPPSCQSTHRLDQCSFPSLPLQNACFFVEVVPLSSAVHVWPFPPFVSGGVRARHHPTRRVPGTARRHSSLVAARRLSQENLLFECVPWWHELPGGWYGSDSYCQYLHGLCRC